MINDKNFPLSKISIKSASIKKLFIFSCIIFFVCHAYCFLNLTYSHDSLMIFQIDKNWQFSLGRIFQPIYVQIRGMITSPLWVGTLTFSYSFLALCFFSKFLKTKNVVELIIVSGMLLSSSTMALSNATYMPWADIYMLAFMLNALGAYIAINHKKFSWLTVICFVLSLGLYQAYIQVGVILLMFDVFKDVIENKDFRASLKKGVCYVILIIISFGIYFCLFKAFLTLYHVEATNNYNGLSNVGHFGGINNMIKYFVGSYKYVVKTFMNPITIHKKATVIASFVILLSSTFLLVKLAIQNRLSKTNTVFLVVLILLFPFGFNFIYFISQGMEHELMTFSFSVVPLFALWFLNFVNLKKPFLKIAVYLSFAVIIVNGIIFANQCYVKKDLERKSTLSIVTRLIDRIEQTDGYVPGETQVCFIGKIENNPLIIQRRAGFNYDGAGNSAWATATYNIEQYIQEFLAYPYRRYRGENPSYIEKQLSPFPNKNCTIIDDGVLYMKVSGDYADKNYSGNQVVSVPEYPITTSKINFCIDSEKIGENLSYIRGWAYHENDICRILIGADGKYYETDLELRPDVQKAFNLSNDSQGFSVTIPKIVGGYSLYLVNEEKKEIYTVKVK